MGRTSDLLNKKKAGNLPFESAGAGQENQTSRTGKMLEKKGVIAGADFSAPANAASKTAGEILRATGKVTSGGKSYTMDISDTPAFERYEQVAAALTGGQEKLTTSRAQLDTLRSAYDADPTEANATAYNRSLAQFQADLEAYRSGWTN